MRKNILKGVSIIGIVDDDGTKFSPIAAVLLRDMAIKSSNSLIRSIRFSNAGYDRGKMIKNSAKSFLQLEGFQTTSDNLQVNRINKAWAERKDLIFVMDRYLKRKIIRDYSILNQDIENKVFILCEFVGINQPIQDPGDDFASSDNREIFLLIKKCCQKLIEMLENAN